MALTCIKMGVATAIAVAGVLLATPCLAQTPGDSDVLAAKEASQKGQWKALETLRPRLAGHPLEAYPAYWLLSGTLERAPSADVQAFLSRYPEGPLTESLRREWLKVLGATAQWDLFRAEFPKLAGDDAEVTCYDLQERIARDNAEAMSEARALFLSGREAPAACEPVFAALAAAKRIGAAETWERIRKVLAAGLVREARRASTVLPARDAIADKALDRANADPAAFLAKERGPLATRAAHELTLYALERLARQKADEAAQRLEKIAARLPPADAHYAWGRIALAGALAHDPQALQWYANAADAPLTDTQIAWRARAALRAGDWKKGRASSQTLSPEEARESAWRHWRARPLRKLGGKEDPEEMLPGLAHEAQF